MGFDNESQRYIDNTIAITTSEFNEENGNVIYAGYENSFNLIYDDKENIKYKYSQEELMHACIDRVYRAVCDGSGFCKLNLPPKTEQEIISSWHYPPLFLELEPHEVEYMIKENIEKITLMMRD